MRRLVPVVLFFLSLAPAAGAWTWPVQGPVLETFSFDQAHPYAAGQRRGIAIGADTGTAVVAPAGGTITFAGSVPTSGKTVTIQTGSGLAVTLTHLGSIAVARDAPVAEGAVVGTVGPSGTAELTVPYVHLGIRDVSNDQGYLDPLSFLPGPATPSAPTKPAPQPVAPPVAAAPVTSAPAPTLPAPALPAPALPAPAPPVPAPGAAPLPAPVAAPVAAPTAPPAAAAVPAPAAPIPATPAPATLDGPPAPATRPPADAVSPTPSPGKPLVVVARAGLRVAAASNPHATRAPLARSTMPTAWAPAAPLGSGSGTAPRLGPLRAPSGALHTVRSPLGTTQRVSALRAVSAPAIAGAAPASHRASGAARLLRLAALSLVALAVLAMAALSVARSLRGGPVSGRAGHRLPRLLRGRLSA